MAKQPEEEEQSYGVLGVEPHIVKPVLKACSIGKLLSLADASEWAHLILGIICGLISGCWPIVSGIAQAYLVGDLAEAYYTNDLDRMMTQAMVGVRVLLCSASAWVLSATVQAYGMKHFRETMVYKLRTMYIESMLHQDMAFFDDESIASLPSQINADMDQISEGLGDSLSLAVFATSCMISGYVAAFIVGWQVALVMSSTAPLIALAQSVSANVVCSAHAENQAHYAEAAEIVEESLYGIKTLISLGHERQALSAFESVMETVRRAGVRKGWKTGALLGCNWLAQISSYSLCFWFGAVCIRDNVVNTRTGKVWVGSEIVAVFIAVFTSSSLLGMINPGVMALLKARICAARIFELHEKERPITALPHQEDSRQPLKHIESIVLDNVFFSYPSRPASIILNGCTLEIKKGMRVALVGGSGCGKSTVICLLERYYDPTQGRVLVNGEDLKKFSIGSVRECMGYVGQEPVLFNGTIRENVIRGCPDATQEEIDLVLVQAQCHFIKDFPDGLETNGGMGGSQFSGGQKQRIAIARALLKKPLVVLMDEATSALDNMTEKKIEEMLDKLVEERAKDGSLTTITVAHRLSTIKNSDCIFMFSSGVVSEKGTHRELMLRQGKYAELAESQAAAMIQPDDDSDAEEEDDPLTASQQTQGDGSRGYGKINSMKSQGTAASDSTLAGQQTHNGESFLALDEPAVPAKANKRYKAPMSRLMAFNRQEWWCLPLACCGALATGGSLPFVGKLIIVGLLAFYNPDKEEMYNESVQVSMWYLMIMCVMYLGTCLQFGTCGILSEAMIKRMRMAIFTHILRQEVGFHDDPHNDPAQLGNNLQQWAFRISTLSDAICVNFASLGSLLVGLAMAAYYCWPVPVLMCACVPILLIVSTLQAKVSASLGGQMPESAQTLMSETVQNPKTVQALHIQQETVRTFAELTRPWRGMTKFQKIMQLVISSFLHGITNAQVMYVMTLSYWFTMYLIFVGFSTFLDSNQAIQSVYFGALGAGAAAVALGSNGKATQAAQDMFGLLDKKSAIDGLDPNGVMPPAGFQAGNIEFVRVTFAYPCRPKALVLRGMSFTVKAGQSVGLVGPSGGGKSTMYALIQRFYDPNAGKVLIGKEKMNLVDLNIRWWRSSIGFVGQEPILFSTTVKENILYGALEGTEVTEAELTKCGEMSNLGFLFENNGQGWDTEVGPRGSRLSGGQKQRVAICRALIRNPPILLLDEATSALDNASEQIVSKALEAARVGRTSFSIAHRLSTVEECDLILVSANGKIVEKGKDAELMMRGGIYLQLQDVQGKDTFCCV